MDCTNVLQKANRRLDNTIDNIVYGRDEDGFVRNARRMEDRQKFGNRRLAVWVPGYKAYFGIKHTLNNQDLTKMQKVGYCTLYVALQLVLDGVKVAGVYGLYQLCK